MTNKIYEIITDKIIQQIESIDTASWDKPWFNIKLPRNAITGHEYRGINTLLLGTQSHWASFKQWKDKDCIVKKGEKSSLCVFWKFSKYQDENGDDILDNNGNPKQSVLCRYYNVFHAGQVEGDFARSLEQAEAVKLNQHETHKRSELLIDNYTCNENITIIEGDRACFYPHLDQIQMPLIGQFKTSEQYYSTFFHEIAHSTGSKHRLCRDKNANNKTKYAIEELVAELSASFVIARVGLANTPRPDHAHYLKSWLQALKNDKSFIISAASQAQKACDYIMEHEKKRTVNISDYALKLKEAQERRCDPDYEKKLKAKGMRKQGGVYRWPTPNTSFAVPKARKCPKVMAEQYKAWKAGKDTGHVSAAL